ncbi:hypothetical protein GpartN1_g2209.t1 [Galdieria partita]|uniref:Kinesin motor domain-containing protein n=1 Tax=Galdieria partita TaxID=83374 RepID=A0A9C7UP25_9RHOD|nr:hypothetical protein GpartN1_g2209.t1 [Galdieria partita]
MPSSLVYKRPITTNYSFKSSSTLSNNAGDKKDLVRPVAPRASVFYKTAQKYSLKKPGNECLDDLRSRLDEQERRLGHLEDNRKAALEKSTLSEEQLRNQERYRDELEQHLNKLLERKKIIETSLETTRAKYESTKIEGTTLTQSIREATVEIQCLKASLDSQQCKRNHFEREAFEQQQRMDEIRKDIETLYRSLDQEKQIHYQNEKNLKHRAEAIEKKRLELEQLQSELEIQQTHIKKKKHDNEKMCDEMKEFVRKSKENELHLEDIHVKIESLLGRLERNREKMARIDYEIQSLEKEKSTLSRHNEQLLNEERTLEANLADVSSKLDSLTVEIQRLKSREEMILNKCKQEADYLYDCLQDSLQKREQLEREVEASHQVSNQNKERWNTLQKQVDELQSIISQKEKELEQELTQKDNLLLQMEQIKESISSQQQEISELDKLCRQDEMTRRYLHNLVQELKGNIRVFCRIRPILAKEVESMLSDNVISDANRLSISSASSVSSITSSNTVSEPQFRIISSNSVEVVAPQRYSETSKSSKQHLSKWSFSFDRIFSPESTQEDVFEEISQLVQSALDGYRVCIFAYGQTGSGKTFTMLGGDNEGESGVIPKSMRKIFSTAECLYEQNWEFHLKASFLEIYNETIRDLLTDQNTGKERNYDIKIDRLTGATYVVGLTVEDISTPYQLEKLLKKSMANRSTAATRCNERSSRSHSVFRLYISGRNKETGQERMGLLNLIDLAGSERLNSSGSTGDRLRETQHINKSLSALGDVISSLSNKEKHIPYRNSKLTYLLQDSLGGDSKTLMFVNVSPTAESFQETLCSLRFAQKVNSCQIGTARRVTKVDLCAGFFNKEATM